MMIKEARYIMMNMVQKMILDIYIDIEIEETIDLIMNALSEMIIKEKG